MPDTPAAAPRAPEPPAEFNYDEAKVRPYTLPDPLRLASGERATTPEQWRTLARPQTLELFRTHVYGRSPGAPPALRFSVEEVTPGALGGSAIRKQVTISLSDSPGGPQIRILMYLPQAARRPVPVFTGLNFGGNHAVQDDPGIALSTQWLRNDEAAGVVGNRATAKSRGHEASRWAVANLVARGYGLATAYYGDLDPDFDDGFQNGVHPLFYRAGQTAPEADEWGAIGAWAWGLSRILDYLVTDPDVDRNRVIVMGHSRLGKTALWAGAQDPRFAIVISNNSGCGGAALSRRWFGETVKRINTAFPHWFCRNFRQYNDNEAQLPVDQHQLIALIAPRPVYVASAAEDLWADPRGEFLSARHADPVYRLLGADGLGTEDMPPLDQSVTTTIGYHVRSGKHDVTLYDWERYMDFADKHLGKA